MIDNDRIFQSLSGLTKLPLLQVDSHVLAKYSFSNSQLGKTPERSTKQVLFQETETLRGPRIKLSAKCRSLLLSTWSQVLPGPIQCGLKITYRDDDVTAMSPQCHNVTFDTRIARIAE